MSKSCETCLYALTHEKCPGCLGNQPFQYLNWSAANLGEQLKRLRELQRSGERNIVIGGQGEAEVNAEWTPKESYEKLFHVAEACGYMITKGRWNFQTSEIELGLPHGHFRIIWWNDQLHAIEQIVTHTIWHSVP